MNRIKYKQKTFLFTLAKFRFMTKSRFQPLNTNSKLQILLLNLFFIFYLLLNSYCHLTNAIETSSKTYSYTYVTAENVYRYIYINMSICTPSLSILLNIFDSSFPNFAYYLWDRLHTLLFVNTLVMHMHL